MKLETTNGEQPAATYTEFKKEVLNEIARCMNMPFNVAAGNSYGYNYASGRLDHQTYFKSIRVEQSQMARVVLDRVLRAWLREAVLNEGYLPNSLRTLNATFEHQWFWDRHEHVDPAKEANAQKVRLASHTTTLANTEAQLVANRVEDETQGDAAPEKTEQLEPVNASLNMNKTNVQSPVAQLRSELASESRRIAGIRKLCAGRHDELEAK